MKYIFFVLCFLFSLLTEGRTPTPDKQFFIRYDVNVNHPIRAVKNFAIGYQKHYSMLSSQYELGVIADGNAHYYSKVGIGVEPRMKFLYLHFFQNVAFITKRDEYLSSSFQFVEEIGIGVIGLNKTSVGLNLQHFSNGGITLPNKGREVFGIQVRLPIE